MKTPNYICTVLRKLFCSISDRRKNIRLKRERYKPTVIILAINLPPVSLSTFQVIKLEKAAQVLELMKTETVAQTDITVRNHKALCLCLSQDFLLIQESLFSTSCWVLFQIQRIS